MINRLLLVLFLFIGQAQAAPLRIEITQGVEGALPIAVVPFAWTGDQRLQPKDNLGGIIASDLQRSGRFKTLPENSMLAKPSKGTQVDFRDWRALNQENLVIGEVSPNGPGGFLVRFQLYDVFRGEQITGYSLATTEFDFRTTAHQIADIIYETLTGEPGAFATRVAYIIESEDKGKKSYELMVADADGYNAQSIVVSDQPIVSPAWSPDGRKLAYVSYENDRPSIWVQEVFTGRREKVTTVKSSSPAWSPDGRSLALTLYKDGSSDIYIMDMVRRKMRQVTRNWSIDTEASWSPDGRELVFTSGRGGNAQVYRISVNGGKAERLTFEGKYNARPSYSPDGKLLTLITQVGSSFRIATLDLDSGLLNVLSDGALDESPSFAPNGSMIIYASQSRNKGVLAAVSTDGRVKQRLALQAGNVREPVWSPYYQQENN